MGRPEGYVENYLKKECIKRKIPCYKFTSPGTEGVPDRLIISGGRVVFVELKSKTGRLSEIQKYRIKEMKEHGAEVYVINSRDGVNELLEGLS